MTINIALTSPVSVLPMVGEAYQTRLAKLGIRSVFDLLYHVPFRYEDFRTILPIAKVSAGQSVTIRATLGSIVPITSKKGRSIQIATVTDETGSIQILWFHQPYIFQTLKKGSEYTFSGKVEWYNKKKSMFSPVYDDGDPANSLHTGRLVPIYPETKGISSKWLRTKVAFALGSNITSEFLPDTVLSSSELMDHTLALQTIHFPESLEVIESARIRLAFNEFLIQQIQSRMRNKSWKAQLASHVIQSDSTTLHKFIDSLPFTLTASQQSAITDIVSDMAQKTPMNRLLEGDVGSGKTVVAGAAAFVAFAKGYQSIFMAPTQILAEQHYMTLSKLFEPFGARIELITGSKKISGVGRADIVVGTHALMNKSIEFDSVGLLVIDEQHRFGVEQRALLTKKSKKRQKLPHTLTMTATPIPRTIALTAYGDLELSTLSESPKGRKPITTWLVPKEKRDGAYGWIEEQIVKDSIQIYIVCPLIDESMVETMKEVRAVTQEFERIKKLFPKRRVGLLHGKLKALDKDKILTEFRNGTIDILVSTPVIEVGIDVPNATIMLIEEADRFGLAQLHQLRGRVGRGDKQSYCLLFTQNTSEKVQHRLSAMKEAHSGFELAEIDLSLRGPGEIYGVKQHGFPQLKVATWQDTEIIKKTRDVALTVIEAPETFSDLLTLVDATPVSTN
jgi:ATP-dependent DNA helicase RecG